ncbi:MAG: hypothetical protein QXU81_10320 [Candidatus Bathyarchaeia archaeon]
MNQDNYRGTYLANEVKKLKEISTGQLRATLIRTLEVRIAKLRRIPELGELIV